MPKPVERTLERMLDFCAQKQKVLSKNIANVGTENYYREDLKFQDLLTENMGSGMKVTNARHISNKPDGTPSGSNAGFEVIEDRSDDLKSGINNVDIDREMAEMAENSLKFKFASKKMSDYYRNIQNVIKSGSGR